MPKPPTRFNPILLVLVAIISVQTGSSFAKMLFAAAPPYAVTLLRIGFATLVLSLVARPRLRGRTPREWWPVVGYGMSLAGMNLLFYMSIARIPIGLAVTLEFLGPLLLALRGARRAREFLWVGLATAGVALLGVFPTDADLLGMAMALGAGAFWATYILLAGDVGKHWSGTTGLTAASGVSFLVLLPGVIWFFPAESVRWEVMGLGLVVAVLATVIPYGLEMTARRSIRSATFSILMSMEPGAAAVLAWLILGEVLGWQEWLALLCVVLASIGATRSARSNHVAA